MTTVPPTNTAILELLEHSAYNPGIVPQLEAYVDAQLQSSTSEYSYSFDANRTLLKLYQFFPHLADEGYISKTFFLALLEFPSTDFTALACLVSEKTQSREPCATLVRCADLLETCKFAQFWIALRQLSNSSTSSSSNSSSSLPAASSTPKSIRKFRQSILYLLSITYTTAPLAVVLSALELESSFALKDFLKEAGNESAADLVSDVKEGECVDFKLTKDNTRRNRVFKEGVSFDAIANIIVASSVTE